MFLGVFGEGGTGVGSANPPGLELFITNCVTVQAAKLLAVANPDNRLTNSSYHVSGLGQADRFEAFLARHPAWQETIAFNRHTKERNYGWHHLFGRPRRCRHGGSEFSRPPLMHSNRRADV